MRVRHTCETYELLCDCRALVVEIECSAVQVNTGLCARCGTRLQIEWSEGRSAL
jgi:hypothetical protein